MVNMLRAPTTSHTVWNKLARSIVEILNTGAHVNATLDITGSGCAVAWILGSSSTYFERTRPVQAIWEISMQ